MYYHRSAIMWKYIQATTWRWSHVCHKRKETKTNLCCHSDGQEANASRRERDRAHEAKRLASRGRKVEEATTKLLKDCFHEPSERVLGSPECSRLSTQGEVLKLSLMERSEDMPICCRDAYLWNRTKYKKVILTQTFHAFLSFWCVSPTLIIVCAVNLFCWSFPLQVRLDPRFVRQVGRKHFLMVSLGCTIKGTDSVA